MFAFFGLVIHKLPEEHPQETQTTDDDKGPFPAEGLGQRRDGKRCGQGADGGSRIEDRRREGAVFLGEVLRRHLDRGREVSGLTEGQDTPAQEEEIHRSRRNGQGQFRALFNGTQGGYGINPLNQISRDPAASGMEAGAAGPYADGNQITLLGPHPVHELAREQAGDRIEDGEEGGNGAIMGICPVEFRFDEFLIRQRKDLAVQVVHRRRHEKQRAQPPAPVGHQFFLCTHVRFFIKWILRQRAYPWPG